MNFRIMNVAFAVIWLLVAGYFLRHRFGPNENAAWGDLRIEDLIALVAIAFVVWNITRLYASRRPRRVDNPLETRRSSSDHREVKQPTEYHPEFDFSRKPDDGGQPSTSTG